MEDTSSDIDSTVEYIPVVETPTLPDLDKFRALTLEVGPKSRTVSLPKPAWMKNAVLYLLNDEQLGDFVHSPLKLYKWSTPSEVSDGSGEEHDFGDAPKEPNVMESPKERLRYKTVISESGVYLIVELCENKENTMDIVDWAFPYFGTIEVKSLIANPKISHCILMDTQPRLIESTSESPFAIIKHPNVDVSQAAPNATVEDRMDYFSKYFGQQVLEYRLIDLPEQRYLMEKTSILLAWNERLWELQFASSAAKNKAMESVANDQKVDILHCKSMLDPDRIFKDWRLIIAYKNVMKSSGIQVILENPEMKKTAEDLFRAHQLEIYDVTQDHEIQSSGLSNRTIVVQQFKPICYTFDRRRFLLLTILMRNGIKCIGMERFERINALPHADENTTQNTNIAAVIDHELQRFKLRLNLEKISWKIYRDEESEQFFVLFSDSEDMRIFLWAIMAEASISSVFAVNGVTPRIQPLCRSLFALPKAARSAVGPILFGFDDEHLKQGNGTLCMEIVREFAEYGETDLVGIEGWNSWAVQSFLTKLKCDLTPKVYQARTQPELFTSAGCLFVNQLSKKHFIMADIDKLNQTITLLGVSVFHVIKILDNFQTEKHRNCISREFKMEFPNFNPEIIGFLSANLLEQIKQALNLVKLEWTGSSLYVEGSCFGIDRIEKWLGELNEKIFDYYTIHVVNRYIVNQTCPICLCRIDSDIDWSSFSCGHFICRECFYRSIREHIENFEIPLRCAVGGCGVELPPNYLMKMILGDNRRMKSLDITKLQKVLYKTTRKVLMGDKRRRICATDECPGIRYKVIENDGVFRSKLCEVCEAEYCETCMDDAHTGTPCENLHELRKDLIGKLRNDGVEVKNCPICGFLIEKTSGCNHMECVFCKGHFCYECLCEGDNGTAVHQHMRINHQYPDFDVQQIDQLRIEDEPNDVNDDEAE